MEDEEFEVVVDDEQTEAEPEAEEVEAEETEPEQPEADDDDEVVITIGDEEPPKEDDEERAAPKWVKELRKKSRDDQKRIRDLERQLQERDAPPAPKPKDPGPKPTIDKFDYDADEFEKALSAWYDDKRKAEDHAAQLEADQQAQQREWQGRLDNYAEAKSKLKVRDYDDAEAAVMGVLNDVQQGIILQGADDPARVVYALGTRPERAKELSSINDPVRFAFAVAKLEKDLKVSSRKAPPPPERKVSGTAPKSGAVDSTLERLRAEAEKTGDYTKVTQYKRQKRQAG